MRVMGKCPLCDRDLIRGPSIDKHHLIPKTCGGKDAELCHRVCHSKIHKTFDEKQLRDNYNTWDSLRNHEDIAKFIKWISKKEPEFNTQHKDSTSRRRGRR